MPIGNRKRRLSLGEERGLRPTHTLYQNDLHDAVLYGRLLRVPPVSYIASSDPRLPVAPLLAGLGGGGGGDEGAS